MASSKKYQWLALAVKKALEKGERRCLEFSFAALADDGVADSADVAEQHHDLAVLATAALAAEALHEGGDHVVPHSRVASSPRTGQGKNHSVSPRRRHQDSSVELGVQTLVDVVRARLRQSLRSWVTHTRQHRLQDLHSSVLQALQTATNASRGPPASVHSPLPKASPHADNPLAANATPIAFHTAPSHNHQEAPGRALRAQPAQLPIAIRANSQPGASLAGRRYCVHSVKRRSIERHVHSKEKIHGHGHPEMTRALLDLASHHGERGDIDAQRHAMQRALEIQQSSWSSTTPHGPGHVVHTPAHSHQAHDTTRHAGIRASPNQFQASSADRIVHDLYADRARVDEVIKLANKLLESGMVATTPRKTPILKASLLLRLAERIHSAAMRDTVQHWWRCCSLMRAVEDLGISVSEPQHGADGKRAHHHHHHRNHSEQTDECQRLRDELKKMENKLAECAANATVDTSQDAETNSQKAQEDVLARENAHLREELLAMQASQRSSQVVEQPELRPVKTQPVQPHHTTPQASGLSAQPGKLVCRIIAAHGLKHREDGTGLHSSADPFVIARVGQVQQHTQSRHEKVNPVWDSKPFEFPVDLKNVSDRRLVLKVVDHQLFHSGRCLGEIEIRVASLADGKVHKKREALVGGDGAEIEYEVVFCPLDTHTSHNSDDEEDSSHAATPEGELTIRVLAVRELQDSKLGTHTDEALHPFVCVRLGTRDFRTKHGRAEGTAVTWQVDPKHFKHVDMSDWRQRTLNLSVYNHQLFHANELIGKIDVHIPDLEANQTTKMWKKLEAGKGGELEFEICFKPSGMAAVEHSIHQSTTSTSSPPLAADPVAAPSDRQGSKDLSASPARSDDADNILNALGVLGSDDESVEDSPVKEKSKVPEAKAEQKVEHATPAPAAATFATSALVDEAESSDGEKSQAEMSDDALADMFPGM